MLNKLQIQGRKIGNLSFHHNMLRPVMDSAKINNIFRISKPNLPQAHKNLNERWNGGILSHDVTIQRTRRCSRRLEKGEDCVVGRVAVLLGCLDD